MVLHAIHSDCDAVVISATDTDVLLLLVAHFPHFENERLLMRTGMSKKRKYIPPAEVFKSPPSNPALALLSFHALIGCDTTSVFANYSKYTTWKV